MVFCIVCGVRKSGILTGYPYDPWETEGADHVHRAQGEAYLEVEVETPMRIRQKRLSCWLCRAPALDFVEVSSFGETERRYAPTRWGAPEEHAEVRHAHAVLPPTPESLEAAGHEVLAKIYAGLLD